MTERKPTAAPTPGSKPQLSPKADATVSQAQALIDSSQTSVPNSTPRNANTEAPLPAHFGRYKIERELGKGAMGLVYLAEDKQLGRKVALKIPKKSSLEDPEVLERFYREAKTTSQIRHNNICPVYDVGEIGGSHYLTMAYIPGKPISSFLSKGKLPAVRQVALLIRKIAQALDEAHKQGVVHRDLKPSNVMLDDRNEPIVMDFGLACQINTAENARLTQSGAILGTPAYMAPEQVRGELDQIGPQSDIYALGVMMYQLLTGELPFTGPIMMIFAQIIADEPRAPSELRPDVDPGLEVICLKMMAKEIPQRYANMKEIVAALTEYIKKGSVTGLETVSAVAPTATIARLDAKVEDLRSLPVLGDEPRPPGLRQRAKSLATCAAGWWKNARNQPRFLLVAVVLVGIPIIAVVMAATLKHNRQPITGRPGAPLLKVSPDAIPNVTGDESKSGTPTKTKGQDSPLQVPLIRPQLLIAPFDSAAAKASQQKWAEFVQTTAETTNSVGMDLALIPPGEFMMGTSSEEILRLQPRIPMAAKQNYGTNQRPKHRVRISRPFYLGLHEVTRGQFAKFVSATGYQTDAERDGKGGIGLDAATGQFRQRKELTWKNTGFPQDDSHPVVNVSRKDAVAFCEWLSKEERKEYRLPTEAEWEYACRAGTTTFFSNSDEMDDLLNVGNFLDAAWKRRFSPPAHEPINYRINDGHVATAPVGSFRPNGFGLFDLHGNVWEFCEDLYDGTYYARSPQVDPGGPLQSESVVTRGGAFECPPRFCLSAYRGVESKSERCGNLGFRVACNIDNLNFNVKK